MKLQKAIKVMEAAGFTFIKKERCKFLNCVDYFFIKNGEVYYWDLPSLRRRAKREDEKMWLDNIRKELKFGVQQTMFADWEVEELYAIENPLEVA